MILSAYIQDKTAISIAQVENTLKLLQEGCTIPFIARYRKDITGNLDEVSIEKIAKSSADYQSIVERKATIINAIAEQGKLTESLQAQIDSCFNLHDLEDLYLPYKKKRKTKADTAKENGLEPLAKQISSHKISDLEKAASAYIGEKVSTVADALQGASDIIAEWMNEDLLVRSKIRRLFAKTAQIASEVVKEKAQEEEAQKYKDYFQWSEGLSKAPSHRILAMLRAEKEGFIKLKVTIDNEQAIAQIAAIYLKGSNSATADFLTKTIKDSYKRLLEPSLSNETLQEARHRADEKAIAVFAQNLTQLLLASPLGEKRILALDPGYRTGCKVVCIDQKGDLLHNDTIYPHQPVGDVTKSVVKMKKMAADYQIEAIAIGNGTASRETEQFVSGIDFGRKIPVFVVNEAGASVYSASKIAREEFPDHDVTVRGAVSIGRRLSDPLAELVKIEPKSIGVGQYQHDVNQSLLKEELDNVVVRCVNKVGVNLNTAGKALLSYVSGIGEKMAENIVAYRSENGAFSSRAELKKVPRLGEKVYGQAVAFLRVKGGKNPLDDSAIHPEAYSIVEQMAKDLGLTPKELIGNKKAIAQIKIENYRTDTAQELYLKDILKELDKPGLDPREQIEEFAFDPSVKTFDDLQEGMVLPGVVNNITAFGCFVDVGVKESGLVHISQLKEGYVADVNEVVKLHQKVMVKVQEIDKTRKRISLTMVI